MVHEYVVVVVDLDWDLDWLQIVAQDCAVLETHFDVVLAFKELSLHSRLHGRAPGLQLVGNMRLLHFEVFQLITTNADLIERQLYNEL